jgi:hypothetical protein
MKVAELLRSIIDVVDRAELAQTVPQARNDLGNFSKPEDVEITHNAEDPEDLFLPPLQMKLELLKKAVGVENVYDDGTDAEREEPNEVGSPDTQQQTSFEFDLAKMKKAAGLNPSVVSELVDDEPLES